MSADERSDGQRAGESLGRPQASERAHTELEQLVERGVVRPGRGSLNREFWDLPKPEDPDGAVLEALLEERRASRR
jgi:hypothetical protein